MLWPSLLLSVCSPSLVPDHALAISAPLCVLTIPGPRSCSGHPCSSLCAHHPCVLTTLRSGYLLGRYEMDSATLADKVNDSEFMQSFTMNKRPLLVLLERSFLQRSLEDESPPRYIPFLSQMVPRPDLT
jgi:hypothetical protein